MSLTYGFWETLERHYGHYRVEASVAIVNVPREEVLILSRRNDPLDAYPHEDWRNRARFGVISLSAEHLQGEPGQSGERDDQGFKRPERGVFVRRDVISDDGRILNRSYLRPDEVHAAGELTAASGKFLAYAADASRGVLDYINSPNDGVWPWSGALVAEQHEEAFAWLESGIGGRFDPLQDATWRPGEAGPRERVLLGSGRTTDTEASWLVYAIGQHLVVEFWRDGGYVTSRTLDLSDLNRVSLGDATYVVGFGYDFEDGTVSLGVGAAGEKRTLVHRTWRIPELVGFGYEPARLGIGGSIVEYDDGEQSSRTAWGRIKPVRGEFTSETPLTKGFLANLMEGVSDGD